MLLVVAFAVFNCQTQAYKENMKDMNISEGDIYVYIAYIVGQATDSIDMSCNEIVDCKNKDNKKHITANILKVLKSEIIDKIGVNAHLVKIQNKKCSEQFDSEINPEENPLYITKETIDDEFSNLDENSNSEIYAKALFWINKLTKLLNVLKSEVIYRDRKQRFERTSYKKLYRKIFTECAVTQVPGEYLDDTKSNLLDEFCNEYSAYIDMDKDESELKSCDNYKKVIEKFQTIKEEASNRSGLNYDITMKDVYAYLYLEKSITDLYMAKEQFLEYSIESIKKDDNNPRISQCYKNEAIDLYQHNISEKEQTHNEIITFVLSGYNTPFCVHADPYKIEKLEKSLGINIDEKKIILNILNFTLYKFDDHKKEDICNIAWGRLYNGKINKACIRAKRMIYNIEALRGIPAPNGKREERN